MLAAPLLRVTVRRGMIMPLFCTRSDEFELAQRILEVFRESRKANKTKSELYDRISAIEESYNDFKLVRGICALLERRCIFNANSYVGSTGDNAKMSSIENGATTMAVDPIVVRSMLFEEASRRGFALTDLERDSIINSISEKLQVSSEDIKKAIWSDLEDNLVFEHFEDLDVKTLIGWYNLSLMQTLLFNATKMEFYTSGGTNWKHILRNVKRLGLMYYLENHTSQLQRQQQDTERDNEKNNSCGIARRSLICSLEGPLSLFKMTERYGTSLAKLLPSIVLAKENANWQIDAWVMRKTMMQGKKLYQFKISNSETLPHLADPFHNSKYDADGKGKVRSVSLTSSTQGLSDYSFDSLVEQKFARKFNEVFGESSGWKLIREPDPLIVADGKALIPDFMFEKNSSRIYLEIVGFWTPEYLERKLQKVKYIMQANGNNAVNYNSATKGTGTRIDLFIAINEELAGSKTSSTPSFVSFSSSVVPPDRLIFYKNDSVPIRPIIDYLKALDKKMIDEKTRDANLRIEVDRSKDIIALKDLTKKYALPIEVVSSIVSRDYSDQYIIVGNGGQQDHCYLISKAKAKKLDVLLTEVKTFSEVCAILSENAIPEASHAELVERLGYEVIWQSMDISTAVIEKRKAESALSRSEQCSSKNA